MLENLSRPCDDVIVNTYVFAYDETQTLGNPYLQMLAVSICLSQFEFCKYLTHYTAARTIVSATP